ncbi:aldo/keto reductase [Alkalicoccobacillus murimartini]|uniref:Diketogulonate reductase-like aldo/keto reductase n=1 Tax=Alkalicoccobacillus murimartini TaxID=171685 RepID=A0ABT9YIH2_9BACI|nr:aldo/keto reductase [Alkalicoccobacillus murimartini]MDQ0207663.1 diketogulonate reductase-like aldo/keto reductase [Alkalicoccobacillus murimartini]
MSKYVKLKDGTELPSIGQGTWLMGEDNSRRQDEIRALQLGLDLGLKVIDTAEMYGEGLSEQLVGEAIKGRRDEAFLVSKVYPHHAGYPAIIESCENSLKRLGTDTLDLYLLHWRGGVPLSETVEGMEKLKTEGKIKRWGISNFDTSDMDELWSIPDGQNAQTNQVLYHLGSRGIEFDLMPWQKEKRVPITAYSPIAHGGREREQLLENNVLKEVAADYGVTPLQLALAWTIRSGDVLSIPKAVQEQHVRQNAEALTIELSQEVLIKLDAAFSPPTSKRPLDII